MKTGILISGLVHLALILLAIFRMPWITPEPIEVPTVTEVSVLSKEEFLSSMNNTAPEMQTDMATMFQPTTEVNDADSPDQDIAPEKTEIDVTEAPSERDSDADISGAFILAQPEVEVEAAQIFAPTIEAPQSPASGFGTSGNSSAPTLSASPVPRSAPRVDNFSAPSLNNFSTTSDRTVEETTPEEAPVEQVEEVQPAEAQPDTVEEIVPEAEPDVPLTAAPPRATLPPRRSNRIADIQAEIEKAEEEPVAEPEVVEEDTTQEADEALSDAINSAINDAFSEAIEEPAETPTQQVPVLTGAQSRGIGEAISNNWNKSIVLGKDNWERLVVKISVSVGPDGTILGDIQPVEPSNPTGDFQVAYDAARRAVLKAATIPLPAGYPDGVRLILRFDPVQGIGLN